MIFHILRKNTKILLLASCLFSINVLAQYTIPVDPLFMPVIFDGKFKDDISIPIPEDSIFQEKNPFPIFQEKIKLFEQEEITNSLRRKVYRNLTLNHIELVKYSHQDFPDSVEKITEIQPNIFLSLFSIEPEINIEKRKMDQTTLFVPKRQYWKRSGGHLLQFQQNYISKNWHTGGVGNFNLQSVQSFTLNYRKNKIQFNNLIEWRLRFFTNPNDTLRNLRIGEDLFRTYSDFGVQAFGKKWSYSTNLEMKTPLFRTYKENSTTYISSLFAPLQLNVGIFGMKYQLEKKYKKDKYKKLTVSADFSPLSIQYKTVTDDKVDPKRFGIEEGRKSQLDMGSTINARFVMQFNRQVVFSSRFKFFSNYDKILVESENELNMALNRYFSTRIYLYGRFDDTPGLKRDSELGLVQLNELLSFGFNYTW